MHKMRTACIAGVFVPLLTVFILFAPWFISESTAYDEANGKKLYERYCASCHGSDGRPVLMSSPDFSKGDGLFQTDKALYRKISRGVKSMPGFRGVMRDSDILDVIYYIRTFF